MSDKQLMQLIYPGTNETNPDIRLRMQLPALVTDVLARAIEKLCETPLRTFDLDYTGDHAGITSDILVLGYEPPHSMVALKLTGEPGAEISFLNHSHPAGEDTIQLRGNTLDGDDIFTPGAHWSVTSNSSHHPRALLDENGMYLAVSYWPKNTIAIEAR